MLYGCGTSFQLWKLFTPFIEWMPKWHPEQHQLQTQSLSMEAILATPPETHPNSH